MPTFGIFQLYDLTIIYFHFASLCSALHHLCFHISIFTWAINTKQKRAWSLEPALPTEIDSTALFDLVFMLRHRETVT